MTVEKPAELANDIEVKLAEVRGTKAVLLQEQRNGLRHSIQLHNPRDPACWVCQEADVASKTKATQPVGKPTTGLSLGMDMAGPLPESPNDHEEKWLLKVKDRNYMTLYGLKWAVAMKDKAATIVLKALQQCISKIRMMASEANRQVVRIHAHTRLQALGGTA